MFEYNDIFQIVVAELRARRRFDEKIHVSNSKDMELISELADKLLKANPDIEPPTPEQRQTFINKFNPYSCAIHRFFGEKRAGKNKWNISDKMVDEMSFVLSAAMAMYFRGTKIIYYPVLITQKVMNGLTDISRFYTVKPKFCVYYARYATLQTIWHERRHAQQHWLLDHTGSIITHSRDGSTKEHTRIGPKNKRDTEDDAIWFSKNRTNFEFIVVKNKKK